ncbi:PREDICTED: roundabout homolog 2-like [Ceratosolen solmsi marchali]|uniref:Roundabout homolog 2-like n=1 Tax=Ceratosolen solmsi marchali TaxID=326594 RepID=A0AAJ6YQV5_9HYME|nr:PREDICTED: roundabout homolog 2-like [Ceratosolen solmsi marchali]
MFPGHYYQERYVVNENGSLQIKQIVRKDEGHYVCSAISQVGATTATVFLSVTSTEEIPPPIIELGPTNQTLILKSTAFFPCRAIGNPMPKINWHKNGQPIRLDPRITILNNGTLVINDLQKNDMGIYTCTASSDTGNTSWSAALKVSSIITLHPTPNISDLPQNPSKPRIVNTTSNSITITWSPGREGSSKIIGYHVEYFSSNLNTGWVIATNRIIEDTYIVTDLRPDTNYVFLVRVENDHGLSLPGPLSDVAHTLSNDQHTLSQNELIRARDRLNNEILQLNEVIPLSSTTMKIIWNILGAPDLVDGMYIRYREMSDKPPEYQMVTVMNAGATSYVLTNLKKYTRYEFFLVPFYKTIEGRPSNVKLAMTQEDIPSSPPENVHVGMINSTSAFVRWAPPPKSQLNGQLIGYKIQIKSNSSNKILGQMSLNASTTSVIINSLNSGGIYTARVAGLTHIGSGPFSIPTLLNMDLEQLHQQPPRSNSNRGNSSIVSETWFLMLMIMMILSIIAALMGTFYLRRRQAVNKQLGHLNVPVSTANDICQLNKDSLWLERGWRPTNSLQHTGDKDCETKLLNNHMIGSNVIGIPSSEYAEVNLTTFYNTRKPSAPPEPYATTTLCVTNCTSESIETSGQKSNSSDSCVKPDYSSLESAQEHNKSTMSPSSDNASSIYTDDTIEYQRRQPHHGFLSQIQQQQQDLQSIPLPNWCDMLPPPPEHPPTPENSLPNRVHQQSIATFSPHFSKRPNTQNILDCTTSKIESPPTPPIRLPSNNFLLLPTSWNSSHDSTNHQQIRYTSLPPQTNPPPVPSFPQGFSHYDVYKAQENEYESGSLIYGHHNSLIKTRDCHTHDTFDRIKQNEESFHTDNHYPKENDDWDRKSCESNTHSDVCYSCSESSCLYADTIEYNNKFVPAHLQINSSLCASHSNNCSVNPRVCDNASPIKQTGLPSPTFSVDSNYSRVPQDACLSLKSKNMHRHNHCKAQNIKN